MDNTPGRQLPKSTVCGTPNLWHVIGAIPTALGADTEVRFWKAYCHGLDRGADDVAAIPMA